MGLPIRPLLSRIPIRRGLGPLVALGLGLGVATCQLDELVKPPDTGSLSVSPAALQDSAAFGSLAVRDRSASIGNTGPGTITWAATLARGSQWLDLGNTSGASPFTLPITLDPDGLAEGVYRDTIVITAGGSVAEPKRVPVTFTIFPCRPTPLAVGATVTDSLTEASCGAPHASGRFARLFSFSAAAGDSVTVILRSQAFDAFALIDSSASGAGVPLAEEDNCRGVTGDACLPYVLIPEAGDYLIEVTSSLAGETGTFALSLSAPTVPAVPSGAAQLRADGATAIQTGGTVPDTTVSLRAVVSDPDLGAQLRLDVEVRPVGTAFTGVPSDSSGLLASGEQATVTVHGLLQDTDYHWQYRARDETGRTSAWTSFGGNGEGDADFRAAIPQAPVAPAALAQLRSDAVTPVALGATVPERTLVFSGTVADPDQGDLLRLEVEIQPVGTPFTGVPTGSSVQVTSGQTAAVTVAGINDDIAYHWQARATDQSGTSSAWVAFGGNAESAADFRIAVPATRLAFDVQPSNTTAGGAITPAVTVRALEASGVTDTAFAASIGVAITSGTGTTGAALSGTRSVAASAGVATFGDLRIDLVGSGYTLTATSSGLTAAASGAFDVLPGTAAHLEFTGQPSDAIAGAAISPPVEVTAVDAQGNVSTAFAGSVTLQITAGTGAPGASLSGGTSVTAAASAGIATFSTLSVNLAATGYALTATSSGFASVASSGFTISAGSPIPGNSFAVVPAGIAGAPTLIHITLRDALGNRVPGQAGSLAVSIGGTNSGASVSAITDVTADTTYTVSYLPNVAGTDLVAVTLAGSSIGGSPYTSVVTAGGASAANSSATVPSGVSGAATPITVTVRDATGNKVTGQALALAVSVSGANAGATVATITEAQDTTYRSSYTPLVAGADNVAITLGSTPIGGSPYASLVSPGPAVAGQSVALVPSGVAGLPTSIVITVRDASGNKVPGRASVLAISVTGANTAAPVVTENPADTTYRASYVPAVTGSDLVAITLSGSPISGSPYTSTVSAGGASPSNSTASVPNGTAGSPTPIVITVRDGTGNKVSGQATVLAAAVGGANAGAAMASFAEAADTTYTTGYTPTVAGTDAVSITLNGTAIGGSPYSSTVAAGQPSRIAISTGNNQSAVAGTMVQIAPAVRVTDQYGNGVPGIGVTFSVSAGGGTVNPSTPVLTDATGASSVTSWTLGTQTGTNSLDATTSLGLSGEPVTFTATATAGTAGQLYLATAPSLTAQSGVPFGQQPIVQLRDANGNDVSTSGIAVRAGIASGTGGSLSGSPVVATNSSGQAVFTDLAISGPTGPYTLSFSVPADPNIAGVSSPTITLSPGAAAKLAIVTQPSSIAQSGVPFPQQPVVEVQDDAGNLVSSTGLSVRALINSGGGTLGGTTTVSTTAGVATFTNLSISGTIGIRTLYFTETSIPAATQPSTGIALGPGLPMAGNSSAAVPGTGTAGIGTSMVITVRDGSSNKVPGQAASLTVTVTGANSATPLVTENTTDTTYRASYTPTVAGTDQVTITLGGTGITGSPFPSVVSAGAASAANTTATVPGTGTAGSATPIVITVRDGNNNLVTGQAASLAVSVSGANPVTAPQPTDNGNGTYTTSYTPTVAGTDQVTITLGGTGITGSPFPSVVGAGAASAANTTATVPAAGTAGSATSVVITVRDGNNNLVTGQAASLAVSVSGANPVTAPQPTDNGNGTYTTSYTPTVAGTDQVTITLGGTGITGSPFPSVVAPGPASGATSTITAVPTSITADGASVSTVTVQLQDALGNTLTASGGTVALATTLGTLSAVTDHADGTYTATLTSATTVGTATVTGTFDPGTGVQTIVDNATVTFVAGLPSAATTTGSVPATGTAGASTSITITVRDGNNNLVTGQAASLVVSVSGANTLTAPQPTDNGNGTYTTSYTPTVAGTDQITITLGGTGINGSPFTSAVSAGTPSPVMSSAVVPTTGSAGVATGVVITVRDVSGNKVAGQAASLVASVTSGPNVGATFTAVTQAADTTYTTSYTPTVVGTDQLAITLNGTAISGNPFSSVVAAGAPSQLVFTQQPTTTTAGTLINAGTTPAGVRVSVRDAFGNVVSSYASQVAIAIASNPTGATLNGTTLITPSAGVAVFGDLSITTAGTGYTLQATSGALTAATSTAFDISAGSATTMTFRVQPSTTPVATVISPPVEVVGWDAYGNLATSFTRVVTLAITPGTGTSGAILGGTPSIRAVLGVATFGDLTIDRVGAGYALDATAPAFGPVTSATFDVTAGTPSPSASTATVPGTGTAGSATSVVITVRDASNNKVPGQAGNLAVTVSGSNAATPAVTANAADTTYLASYTPTVAGTDQVAITLGGTAISGSPYPSVVSAGAASAANTTATVPGTGTAGSATSVVITVRDASNNKVPGQAGNLALSVTSGPNAGATFTLVTQAADTTYTTSYTPTVAGTDQVAITLGGTDIGGSPYPSVVSAGAAVTLEVTGLPDPYTTGAASDVTVTARDANGNVATGYAGTVSITTTDPSGTVPVSFTFQSADAGSHTFAGGVTLVTAGNQTVTATDTVTPSITGSQTVTVQ